MMIAMIGSGAFIGLFTALLSYFIADVGLISAFLIYSLTGTMTILLQIAALTHSGKNAAFNH